MKRSFYIILLLLIHYSFVYIQICEAKTLILIHKERVSFLKSLSKETNEKEYYNMDEVSAYELDQKLLNWIKSNISPITNLPYSFQIRDTEKKDVYLNMGASDSVGGIIERMIVEEGLIIYDGAVGQIVLTMAGGNDNLKLAKVPVNIYWKGRLNEISSIRAGYPINTFIYDPQDPYAISSDLNDKGKRGFIFRIINANGKYNTEDPLDNKTRLEGFPNWPNIHWEDWKPVAGENAWVAMAALHLYHKKYYDEVLQEYVHDEDSEELLLAEELARAAMLLQADTGGIRMAPLGTFREGEENDGSWWYTQISSENNISWYAAFRMLFMITEKEIYREAMEKVEEYFKLVWNEKEKYFYQGMNYRDGQWFCNNEHFALDVQTWGIAAFGVEKIDSWFGSGSSYEMWQTSRGLSGCFDEYNNILGVGYTKENDRISVEWTAGAILAARMIADYYKDTNRQWSNNAYKDAKDMRYGIELLKKKMTPVCSAYSYSSKRGWIPFGWYSHSPEVVSLASTGWVVFVDAEFNPFLLESCNLKKKFRFVMK